MPAVMLGPWIIGRYDLYEGVGVDATRLWSANVLPRALAELTELGLGRSARFGAAGV